MPEGIGALGLARQCVAAVSALKAAEGNPTEAQRHAMAGWAGWGPLAAAFNWQQDQQAWKEIRRQLHELLNTAELKTAADAVDTAFYTPRPVTRAMWDIATGLGFTGGAVLEPGCGAGYFMAATPPGLDVAWTGVEVDGVTAAIAQALHPAAAIINGRLEKTALRRGSFDLVIGNVPFSQAGPYDASAPDGLSLHNYFIWRSLAACRPGGLVVLVTSRWTMDALTAGQRESIAGLGSLIGAIRLPSTALAAGGTAAVADIVVFHRHREPAGDQLWKLPARQRPLGLQTSVSEYFLARPAMVLGQMTDRGGQQFGATLDVVPPAGVPLADLLAPAVAGIVKTGLDLGLDWQAAAGASDGFGDAEPYDLAEDGRVALHADGTVTKQVDGQHKPLKATPELVGLCQLKDAAVALFAAEADRGMGANECNRIRQGAFRRYQEFTARFGPLNRSDLRPAQDPDGEPGDMILERTTKRQVRDLRSDPDYSMLIALEIWDDETQSASPAPILLRHVNRPAPRPDHTDDPGEALALTLDECGQLDMGNIARLLDVPVGDVPRLLAGLIWEDPDTGQWVTADEYLSGNVRVKLAVARTRAGLNPDRWAANVAALEQVQPADLAPEQINAQLGSPWVPSADIETFTAQTLGYQNGHAGRSVKIIYSPLNSAWEVHASVDARRLVTATAQWGTGRINAHDLIQTALNGTAAVVYDPVPGTDRKIRNEAETQLANDRIRDLQERFGQWIWEDPARTDRLCHLYNWRYNATRVRRYDGSFLTFPGMDARFKPYPSQLDMVARAIFTPASLCGHAVGAGKTAIMAMTAWTLRRLGLASKPAMIVPNHLLEQETAEARRLFPGARILMVTREDLAKERRRVFAAKVGAQDWDIILMTHQQWMALKVAPEVEQAFIAAQIEELEAAVMDDHLKGTRTAKQLARKRKKLVAKHEQLLHAPRDLGVTFEQCGIDFVMADEGHMFKNLELSARAEGFSTAGSKRASDLAMKLMYLREHNRGGRSGMLLTGTPISNSLAELYVLFRYLMPDQLADLDLPCFDAFAGQFIRYRTSTEVAPDGSGFRSYRRPTIYCNVPELRAMLGEVADIRTKADLQLPGPRVSIEHVAVDGQPELGGFTAGLVERADKIRSGVSKRYEDNMLSVCTDGRRGALDLRLVGIEPTGPGKIEAVAAKVAGIYHQTASNLYPDPAGGESLFHAAQGSLQLVFIDQGTPKTDGSDDQVYGRLAAALVAAGVPRERIAFAHDAKTHADRAALFARCRNGQVAVLLGSTEKCGTGVNVQPRLVAIHHMDAPWRPADVEQRDGRGDRPGNWNDDLLVIRYVTKRSFDAYMWQALSRKKKFVDQLLTGDLDCREVEDAGGDLQILSFTELKALAADQPLLMELSRVQAEITRLRNQSAAHTRNLARLQWDQATAHRNARMYGGQAQVLRAITEAATGAPPELMSGGRLMNGDAAAEHVGRVMRDAREQRRELMAGKWRGVYIRIEPVFHGKAAAPSLNVKLDAASWSDSYGYQFRAQAHVWKAGGAAGLLAEIDEAIGRAEYLAGERERAAELETERAAEIEPFLREKWPHQATLDAELAIRRQLEAEIDAQVAVADAKVPVASAA